MSAIPELPAEAPAKKPRPNRAGISGRVLRFPFRAAPGTIRRNDEELAFLPAALEIVETPTARQLR